MRVYIDANIFILPVISSSSRASTMKEVLSEVEGGNLSGITSSLTLDEVVWVVRCETDEGKGIATGRDMMRLPNLEFVPPRRRILSTALNQMEKHQLKPRDAIHSATMKERGLETILSDDSDFDRIDWISRPQAAEFLRKL